MKTPKMIVCLLLALLIAVAPMCAFAQTIYLCKAKNACIVYNKSGKQTGALSKGEYVLAVATSQNKMLKVMTTSGKTGYVAVSNMSRKASADTSTLGTIRKNTTVYGIKNAQPYTEGVLPAGTPVIVETVISGYAKVRSLHGLTGYIKASAIKHL